MKNLKNYIEKKLSEHKYKSIEIEDIEKINENTIKLIVQSISKIFIVTIYIEPEKKKIQLKVKEEIPDDDISESIYLPEDIKEIFKSILKEDVNQIIQIIKSN